MRTANTLLLLITLGACGGRPVVRVDGSAGVLPLVAELSSAYRATGPRDSIVLGSGMGSRMPANVAEGAYRLHRKFLLVTRATPAPAVARFLAFAGSPRGRDVIRAAGAIPPR